MFGAWRIEKYLAPYFQAVHHILRLIARNWQPQKYLHCYSFNSFFFNTYCQANISCQIKWYILPQKTLQLLPTTDCLQTEKINLWSRIENCWKCVTTGAGFQIPCLYVLLEPKSVVICKSNLYLSSYYCFRSGTQWKWSFFNHEGTHKTWIDSNYEQEKNDFEFCATDKSHMYGSTFLGE